MKKRHPLRISRGESAGSVNLFVTVSDDGVSGLGEAAPGGLTGADTAEACEDQIRSFLAAHPEALANPFDGWRLAREQQVAPCAWAAVDIALWDLLARRSGQPLYRLLGLPHKGVATSVTIGILPPEVVKERVPEVVSRTGARYLKVKLGSPEGLDADCDMFTAVQEAAGGFGVSLRVDANGGWDLAGARRMMAWLKERGCDYVEQPLHYDADEDLPALFADRVLPVFIDESCNFASDAARLAGCVDGVNLKLMKCGGITEALRIVATARAHRLETMIGCMGESSVAIGAGASLAALFDHIDLDSHLNLLPDPASGLEMNEGVVSVRADQSGHGVSLTC
ncbi:MAG: dipeptide epimerase [Arenicellales bacterium]|nr:dipeptide epimerase [Arenicellales bacterium]MDP6918348.1 dipeptide epimerase [Arenicellales bacterium]